MTANGNLTSMNNTTIDQLRMQQTTNPMNTINTMNSNLANMASNMQPGMNIPGTESTIVGNNINNNTNVGMVNNNYKRLMDMNKNALLNPFGKFRTYPTTVGDINRIPIPPQFSNQISFNMPPPGGISYMIPPGYPYNFSSSTLANRFPPSSTLPNSLENQQQINSNIAKSNPKTAKDKQLVQKQKQLLKCHTHWLNWVRASTQLNKRKKAQSQAQSHPKSQPQNYLTINRPMYPNGTHNPPIIRQNI